MPLPQLATLMGWRCVGNNRARRSANNGGGMLGDDKMAESAGFETAIRLQIYLSFSDGFRPRMYLNIIKKQTL